jgi:hypothetical protein
LLRNDSQLRGLLGERNRGNREIVGDPAAAVAYGGGAKPDTTMIFFLL